VRKSQLKLRLLYRLPEIDFVDAGDVQDDIERLIIRDTDIEFHGSLARLRPFFLAASDRQFTKVPILLPI